MQNVETWNLYETLLLWRIIPYNTQQYKSMVRVYFIHSSDRGWNLTLPNALLALNVNVVIVGQCQMVNLIQLQMNFHTHTHTHIHTHSHTHNSHEVVDDLLWQRSHSL